MRARNKLLGEEGPWDEAWLDALEARMAEHGAVIAEARAAAIAALDERLAAAPDGPFARARLTLEGGESADLAASRGRDAAAGRTLAGPHRADLAVTHEGKAQPAALCSTGEQKALLIGLILAHADLVAARTGRRPILLLDEIAAHLDPLRRAALFERLAGERPGLDERDRAEPVRRHRRGALARSLPWADRGRRRRGFYQRLTIRPAQMGHVPAAHPGPGPPTPKICPTSARESAPNAAPPIRSSAARWRPITARCGATSPAAISRSPRSSRWSASFPASSRSSPRRRSARSASAMRSPISQLFIHEAAHYNLAPTRQANDKLADRLICWQVGTTIAAYRRTHAEHHRHLGGPHDTEISYTRRLTPRFLIEMVTGIHALRVFTGRAGGGTQAKPADAAAAPRRRGRASRHPRDPARARRLAGGARLDRRPSASSSRCSRPCASCSSIAPRPANPRMKR